MSFLPFFLSMVLISSNAVAETKFRFEHDAAIQGIQSKSKQTVERGTTVVHPLDEPLQITSDNHVPMIVVPAKTSLDVIDINLPTVERAAVPRNEEEVGRLLSVHLSTVADIQNLIAKKRVSEAAEKLKAFQAQYPKVKFLEFIRATILFLQGDRQQALDVAEAALKLYPDYEEGKRFIESLKGARQ